MKNPDALNTEPMWEIKEPYVASRKLQSVWKSLSERPHPRTFYSVKRNSDFLGVQRLVWNLRRNAGSYLRNLEEGDLLDSKDALTARQNQESQEIFN